MKNLRSLCMAAVLLACCANSMAQSRPAGIVTGTWTPLVNQPTFGGAVVPLLMTDGSVMVQDCNNYDTGNMTNHWWKLTPDINGSYVNGTWTQLADMDPTYGPLFYASAVLPDGRVFVMGGEYNEGVNNWTNKGAIYTPSTNTWANLSAPPGWTNVGDAECTVLPNGKLMLANSTAFETAILDPATLTWTAGGLSGKTEHNFDEEGWNLLPDGTIVTVDVVNTPNAEKYVISSDSWVPAGSTPVALTSPSLGYEMGPAILRFDGTVLQFGANPHTAIYTPPATPTDPGSWVAGADMPGGNQQADGPACLLPSGNVLVAASPGPSIFGGPCNFFETNGTAFTAEPANDHSAGEPSFIVNFMVLPNGQVMETDSSSHVEIYTPVGGPADAWRPTITTAPGDVAAGDDYPISGTQFNGLSQTNAYGDDWTNATNYPIVRITNNATGHVFYCTTHDHSTMAVGTGSATVSTHFTVPASIETGDSTIQVVANGIPSASQAIFVGSPSITSLNPNSATSGDPNTSVTINGDGFAAGAKVDWFDASSVETQLTPDTLSGSVITVTVPASLLTTAQTCTVEVENPGSLTSNSLSFTINPANHPPVANAGSDQTIEATGPTTSFTLDGTGSTDADNDPLTYTWFNSSNVQVGTGSKLTLSRAVGVYTFKLTVSDGKASNDDTVQITIQDTTPPAFGVLPDITVAPTSNAGAVVTFGPFTANDLVDGAITGTAVPASGSTFPAGTTTVNVSATDSHSNTGHASFHVNVMYSWSGFLSPFPKQQFKMGSTIPIKFSLTGASAGITNLVATGYWATVNGAIVGPDHTIGTFKYSNGSYQLNWKTNVPKGTYQIKAVFGDGSVHTIQVVLK